MPGMEGIKLDVCRDGKQLRMEIDAASSVSIASETTWEFLESFPLQP